MRLFMYAHGGSGNHGCEAIVRSTLDLLRSPESVLISSRPEEDMYYGIDRLCTVIKDTDDRFRKNDYAGFIKAYLELKIKKDYVPMERLRYNKAFSQVNRGDTALSIGGDNYCYRDVNRYILMHGIARKRGAKTVLWGCSVESDVLKNPSIAGDLAEYSLIAARETISYEALKAVNSNTVLITDPAFTLGMRETVLPWELEEGNTVGINLSPMAMENEVIAGVALKNYSNLIKYIIKETSMNVALIPHVVWAEGDDRLVLRKLYEQYKDTKRICLIEDHTCEELKYVISKCRFFVGARTHATIAAYSTCIPTLVLGYSVKSKGIARDLFGTYEGFVIPVQSLRQEDGVLRAFGLLKEREAEIRRHLEHVLPAYLEKNRGIDQIIAGL